MQMGEQLRRAQGGVVDAPDQRDGDNDPGDCDQSCRGLVLRRTFRLGGHRVLSVLSGGFQCVAGITPTGCSFIQKRSATGRTIRLAKKPTTRSPAMMCRMSG